MPSIKSILLEKLIRLVHKKNSFETPAQVKKESETDIGPPFWYHSKLKIKKKVHKDRCTVFKIMPREKRTKKHVLFFHGGGYMTGFRIYHWHFLRNLILHTNCSVTAPDYPLAPNHTYKDVFKAIIPVYIKLIKKYGGKNLILMGDSAGGGLALALAEKMKESGIENADQIVLLSPWLDLALPDPLDFKGKADDPILSVEGLRNAGNAYAGGEDLSNYLLSPIHGNIEGIGKISLFIGTNDILLNDARKFKKIADKRKVKVNFREYEGMIHDWVYFDLPESKEAFSQIVELFS